MKQNDRINPLDGDLTFVGRVLGSLPVDVSIGKLLLIGYAFGVLEECIVIGRHPFFLVILNGEFLYPRQC